MQEIVLVVVQDKVIESPSEIEDDEEINVSIIGLIDIIGFGVKVAAVAKPVEKAKSAAKKTRK